MNNQPHADHRRDSAHHLRVALEQAGRLAQARPADGYGAKWSAQAAHVGDLSVLALALRD